MKLVFILRDIIIGIIDIRGWIGGIIKLENLNGCLEENIIYFFFY